MATPLPRTKEEHHASLQEQKARIIAGVHSKQYTPSKLPHSVYTGTANILKTAMYKGYGDPIQSFKYNSPDYAMLYDLRTNVYMFSAAKTFQQTLEMSAALVDENGNIREFADFKDIAGKIFDRYNVDYLNTEWNTALGMSRSASKYVDIQSEIQLFPYLTYVAVMDEHTCEICGSLDGITLPADDPFWDENMPLNHYNCECTVEQLEADEGAQKETSDEDVDDAVERSQLTKDPLFNFNPGKDKVLFQDSGKFKHPYFETSKAYQDLAKNNFNLAIPEHEEGVKLQEPVDNIPRDITLKGEDAELQERSIQQFLNEKDELVKQYIQDYDNVVNTDEARKAFRGYNGLNASDVHEAASALAKEVQKKLIAEGDLDTINAFAGGGGAGKSSSIMPLFPSARKADVVIDGTMANVDKVIKQLDTWIAMDKKVNLFYVWRDPVDAWENGVVDRMLRNTEEKGRPVRMSTFIEQTKGALNTFQKLEKKGYQHLSGVKIKLIDNNYGLNSKEMSKDELMDIKIPTDLRAQLIKKTDELYRSGKLTKEQYEALIK